ncbi:MAG TPA: mechanosensitive ion channel [Spirochaetota bacterium]|nr:mechanosensitive ion channel [Spirochaetota bacterium]
MKRCVMLAITMCMVFATHSMSQPAPSVQEGKKLVSFPVTVNGSTLFSLSANLGPLSAGERAARISKKLKYYKDKRVNIADSLSTKTDAEYILIHTKSDVLMAVSTADAEITGTSREYLAREYIAVIKRFFSPPAIENHDFKYYINKYRSLILHIAYSLATIIGILVFLWISSKLFNRLYNYIESLEGTVIRAFSLRSHEIVSSGSFINLILIVFKSIRLILTLGVLYYSLIYIFSLFPIIRAVDIKSIMKVVLLIIFFTATAIGLFKLVQSFFEILSVNIPRWKGSLIKPLKVKTIEILSEERIVEIVVKISEILKILIYLLLLYFYISLLFSLFEFTSQWTGILLGYIYRPLSTIINSFVQFIPNLFFIIVIIFITRYMIKFSGLLFFELKRGSFSLPGFDREWAQPTYKILRFLIIIFAVIVIFPYIPGSQSEAFKGVSIFLGVLFSLGSTSIVANIVAGVILTYMNAFKDGDRVTIGDATGDIIEKTLLITRIRTVKNVIITIPNGLILGSHIINFSSSAKNRGLVLHTAVTIGYDVPWRIVHEELLRAAKMTEHILEQPEPFVLQKSLDDFYVSYELNAYTDKPHQMAGIYSQMHQNIQDCFNDKGIEIMSPHYSAARDGNLTTIPGQYVPSDYMPPSFRILMPKNTKPASGKKRKKKE